MPPTPCHVTVMERGWGLWKASSCSNRLKSWPEPMPLDIDDDKPFSAISNSNIQVPFQVSEGPNYFFLSKSCHTKRLFSGYGIYVYRIFHMPYHPKSIGKHDLEPFLSPFQGGPMSNGCFWSQKQLLSGCHNRGKPSMEWKKITKRST